MTPANITSSNPVSSHDVSSEGKQVAADEADLKVWQEGSSSKARKNKKRRGAQVLLISLFQVQPPVHRDTWITRTILPSRSSRPGPTGG
ncbi:hypothetical protein [Endozoicomonas sp. GU-1]|uniref:hypothetical protein n=1 Tax=Endozoicomonas sp. GU-1 TaxID=3009078 RepID=UPI0022B5A2CE|nr:hypothetical protein [Endozoicomonas sp. GU-1]WBA81043.1 hypothetical protein O2T12_22540 [Endozoicomonas sp. GU-1]